MGRMTRIARFVAIVVTSALAMGQSSPVQAANSRLLTAEELIARTRFGEPALSPDGRWILYTMRIVDLEKNASTSMVMRLQLNDLKTPPLMLGTGSQPQWVGEGGRPPSFACETFVPENSGPC